MRITRGFTLIEMLGVVAGMSCLAMFLVPALDAATTLAQRSACAANLYHLGMALRLYAADYDGRLPDCGACSSACGPAPCDGRHVASRSNAPGTCNWPHVRAVGNQANLWILVREGYAAPRQFICPATSDRPSLNNPLSLSVMGFLALDPATGRSTPAEDRFLKRVAAGHCSYSYQNQFVHTGANPDLADPLNATTLVGLHPADLPILADRNPYTRTDLVRQPVVTPADHPEANSPNHGGTGQNVLYLQGEVEWHDSPRCGPVRDDGLPDNIYWPDSGNPTDPLAVPVDLKDSYLAP
jgi:type II secretory pathway pseudopilin PulG